MPERQSWIAAPRLDPTRSESRHRPLTRIASLMLAIATSPPPTRSALRRDQNRAVARAASVGGPHAGRGAGKRSRSRGAIFVRARVLCPTMLLTASPLALFPGFPCARPRLQTKGKRNAERRVVNTRALRARGAPCGGARLSASHRGSCQRDSWSPRLCTRPCFGRQSGALDPMDRQPGRGSCASPRVLPAPEKPTKQTVPVQ